MASVASSASVSKDQPIDTSSVPVTKTPEVGIFGGISIESVKSAAYAILLQAATAAVSHLGAIIPRWAHPAQQERKTPQIVLLPASKKQTNILEEAAAHHIRTETNQEVARNLSLSIRPESLSKEEQEALEVTQGDVYKFSKEAYSSALAILRKNAHPPDAMEEELKKLALAANNTADAVGRLKDIIEGDDNDFPLPPGVTLKTLEEHYASSPKEGFESEAVTLD